MTINLLYYLEGLRQRAEYRAKVELLTRMRQCHIASIYAAYDEQRAVLMGDDCGGAMLTCLQMALVLFSNNISRSSW